MPEFGYLTVASPLHDSATVDRVTAGIRASLDEADGARTAAPEEHPEIPLAVLVATGGTEAAVIELVARRQAVVPDEPVLLLAHPLHNSLPAALEAMARLHADGRRGRIVQVEAGVIGSLVDAVHDVAALRRLRATRLGLVGEPSDWLVASVPDAARLRARWGIELVPIDIGASIEAQRRAEPAAVQSVTVRFAGRGMPDDDLAAAAALHPALTATITEADVDAITVRCFDYLTELSTSGCVALAVLNDTGTVAGCEGDVASAVAMLWVRALLDRPSWMANPARIDEDANQLLLAHCTVAPSLVEEVELHTHFESGLGIGLRGRFAPGWVTLLRLGGPALERCWLAEGEIVGSGTADDVCRTQVTVRLDHTPVGSLLEAPLGNHLVMVPGRHSARLERWWRLAFGEDPRA